MVNFHYNSVLEKNPQQQKKSVRQQIMSSSHFWNRKPGQQEKKGLKCKFDVTRYPPYELTPSFNNWVWCCSPDKTKRVGSTWFNHCLVVRSSDAMVPTKEARPYPANHSFWIYSREQKKISCLKNIPPFLQVILIELYHPS